MERRWLRWVVSGLRWVCCAAAVGFLVMWLAGMRYYTSVGWDTETETAGRVHKDYYRVRWPGNGDIWIGGGGHARGTGNKPPVAFDAASTCFEKRKRHPETESAWNRWGWWWLEQPAKDPSDGPRGATLTWGRWVGVPGWLPVLLFGAWPLASTCRRLRCRPLAIVDRAK